MSIARGRLVINRRNGALCDTGFIDVHSHSDFTLMVDPRAMSCITQGVTLEVIDNCGNG